MTQPPSDYYPTPPPAPQIKRARRWPWIAAVVAALIVGIGIGAAGNRENTQTNASQPAPNAAAAPVAPPATTTTAKPKATKPTPEQFTLAVKVLEKKCFGSAGCNVTYRIEPKYIGTAPLPDETIIVIYEVAGGDDPQTNQFKLSGDGTATFDGEERIQTPKSSSVLTAKVTAVM